MKSPSSLPRTRTAPASTDSKFYTAKAQRSAKDANFSSTLHTSLDHSNGAHAAHSFDHNGSDGKEVNVEFLGNEINRALDAMNERLDSSRINPMEILDDDDKSAAPSEVGSEASMDVLMRYMGLSSRPYMTKLKSSSQRKLDAINAQYTHDLREGDHVIRWKMLGYCYPIQVHGIVFSAGPDVVTIVDCGWASEKRVDKVGNFDDDERKKMKKKHSRMNILTLVDEKEIKKWTKIRYGEEVELKVHSKNEEMQKLVKGKDYLGEYSVPEQEDNGAMGIEQSPSAGLELEEVEQCVQAKIKSTSPEKSSPAKSPRKSWFSLSCNSPDPVPDPDPVPEENMPYKPLQQQNPKQKSQKLTLPNADPPTLVLARLRFLLEYGEAPFPPTSSSDNTTPQPTLLPPHHLLYANSECIAVFCKTGSWSTLQASIFLHSSTVGNVKQTATVAMFLSAQTVTVPASGFWGFFGGTTTIGLFTAQPWLVPALVGGGMVYIGLPTLMLRKAKGRWAATERILNDAFWSNYDTDVIVEMIQCWSGLES